MNRFERFQDRDGNFYAFDHEVLAVVRVPAEPEIAEVLELAPDTDHVWKIKRLLKSNGELIILDEMFLNPRCFGEEVREKIERLDPGQSMYAYFESEFCQKIASCRTCCAPRLPKETSWVTVFLKAAASLFLSVLHLTPRVRCLNFAA